MSDESKYCHDCACYHTAETPCLLPRPPSELAAPTLLCDGVEAAICPKCEGRGYMTGWNPHVFGFRPKCFNCNGTGRVPADGTRSHSAERSHGASNE